MAAAKAAEGLVFDKVTSSGQRLGQNIQCNYCKRLGHMKDTCRKLAYNNAIRAQQNANMVASDQQGSSNAEIPNENAVVNERGEY